MFKANNQPELFTLEKQLLNNEHQKVLEKTPEKAFHTIIFANIKESDYKVMFSETRKPSKRACKCISFSPDIERA